MKRAICLSPTTFISTSSKEVLFYDSESGVYVKYPLDKAVEKFVHLLHDSDNMYSICEEAIPNKMSVQKLIQELQSQFLVDYIEYGKTMPFVVPPFLKCHEQLWEKDYPKSVDSNLFSDIYFYLNGTCGGKCPDCKKKTFQMIHCTKDDGILGLEDVKRTIEEVLSYYQPITIHLCGGDIGQYPPLRSLAIFLGKVGLRPQVHMSYLNWNNRICNLLDVCNPIYIFTVDFPVENKTIEGIINRCKLSDDIMEFVVTSDEDVDLAESLIEDGRLENAIITPYYTGNNLAFFKQQVFMEEEEILTSVPSKQLIFQRMIFNVNNIGKLFIRSNGFCYANLNKHHIGTIGQPLSAIAEKEWLLGKSWRDIRKYKPCSSCIYQYLCPSPSNYEYVIGKTACALNIDDNEI